MRKQSLFLLPHFFLTSLFSAKKMKGMMYRVYFFRREFWKKIFLFKQRNFYS
ncbi:hypothetical protein HMPREF1987_00198 [Peptostreptococcaceae bacterium oral taxon 113 str. W5053]|nr:hypothetical protein HMPREF1987_00198 [Peptostreptococcaceae bacterium oral taxon 113 str. W5053]